MEPFYYQHLTKSEQVIYHAIKTGLTALEDHFLVPYADHSRISMIFFFRAAGLSGDFLCSHI